jgi:ATP-dependent Clp protease protease subunit
MRSAEKSTEDGVSRPSTATLARLFEARTVLIFGEVSMALAQSVSAELLALASASSAPIRVLLNSPGGHVESGDTIRDVLRFIPAEVSILGTGWVASAGALIYTAVPRERRFSLPNTRFMLHQPTGGVGGPASDIEIEAQQIMAVRARLNRIFAEATGQSFERIARDTERNHWLSADEAVSYGLVGQVISSESEIAKGRS